VIRDVTLVIMRHTRHADKYALAQLELTRWFERECH